MPVEVPRPPSSGDALLPIGDRDPEPQPHEGRPAHRFPDRYVEDESEPTSSRAGSLLPTAGDVERQCFDNGEPKLSARLAWPGLVLRHRELRDRRH